MKNMLRILGSSLLLLCSIVAVQTPGAFAMEIVYPADKTSIVKSDYLIIKSGDEIITGISIDINGISSDVIDVSSEEYRKYFRDMLILQPEFDAGKNKIQVEGYANGKVIARAEAEVFFKKTLNEGAPEGFTPFVMHTAEREAKCAGCHYMSPSQSELDNPSPSRNPCASCHRRMLSQKHVHGPAGVWECGTCHDANSQPRKYELIEENTGILCGECHEDKVDEFKAQKYVHGPIEAGLCVSCHDAHASNHRSQLLRSTHELCMSCHDKITTNHVARGVSRDYHPLKGPSNPKSPKEPFNCTSCHDPHAGVAKGYFAGGVTSRLALCQWCHEK